MPKGVARRSAAGVGAPSAASSPSQEQAFVANETSNSTMEGHPSRRRGLMHGATAAGRQRLRSRSRSASSAHGEVAATSAVAAAAQQPQRASQRHSSKKEALAGYAGDEQQSPLSRIDPSFQGEGDDVAVGNSPDSDVDDDDSYTPSVLSDNSESDDENELDWKPIPMNAKSVNISFNGVDGELHDRYLSEAKEVRKRFIKQVCYCFA